MRKEARVVVGPQAIVEGGDHFVGRGAHDDAPALLERALEQAGQRLVDPPPLEMMKADLASLARRADDDEGAVGVGRHQPELTPPGTCSSVLPAT